MPASRKIVDAEAFIPGAYALAEKMDLDGWRSSFTDGGVFTDNSIGVTYEGPELDYPVRQCWTARSRGLIATPRDRSS
jgi:hypothetical protein